MAPCPHCGGTTTVEPHRALRWICSVCGGPVVPADTATPRTNAELASLVRAKRARAIAFGWTAGMIAFVVMSLMTLGLGALLMAVAWLPVAILAALGVVLFVMAMGMRKRARTSDDTATRELDAAWESVAGEVLRARDHDVTAKDLAKTMQTTETHAETLLSALSAHDRARVDVGDDAELRYSAKTEVARVRVAEDDSHDERTEGAIDPARHHGETERR
jgi:hypothetical protein